MNPYEQQLVAYRMEKAAKTLKTALLLYFEKSVVAAWIEQAGEFIQTLENLF